MNGYCFSGSYKPEDVIFLLKTIDMKPVDITEKERRIQSGQSHYSEIISKEQLPSDIYLTVFKEAFDRNERRMAMDIIKLAHIIANQIEGDVTIVSLARAGTPIGIILNRTLNRFFRKTAVHYSISIIRDRGIDENALLHLLRNESRSQEGIVFVDGWTGKGVISQELKKSVRKFNIKHNTNLSDKLYVLSDLCGHADVASSCEDYMIPSSVLNSTISGLVSRSIMNDKYIGANDFHGCLFYKDFEEYDLSNWFVDRMTARIHEIDQSYGIAHIEADPISGDIRKILRDKSVAFIHDAIKNHNVKNINFVKPGIGEATRVLLRRVPDKLILRSKHHPDLQHLLILAREKIVPVVIDGSLPYNAAAFIQNLTQ